MKTTNFFEKPAGIIIILVLFALNLNAQIKVESIGRVQVGTVPNVSNVNDADNITSMQIFGKEGSLKAGSKLTFGDFGRQAYSSWNVFIGEYSTTDTDQLWLHGKMGTYLTNGNGTVIAYHDLNSGNSFKFNCDIYSNGIKLTSDERLKENIQPLSGSLSSLQRLHGVSYYLKKPAMRTPVENTGKNNESPS